METTILFWLAFLIIVAIIGLIVLWIMDKSILIEIIYAIYCALIIFAWLLFAVWHLDNVAACIIF